MLKEFQRVGRLLLHLGLISSHGGNASVRRGGYIYITRHSAMLGDLRKDDVVKISFSLGGKGGKDKTPAGRIKLSEASMEYPVHRQIYETTGAGAVIHAHPAHAIALSLVRKKIRPLDAEGTIFLGEVPVIATRKAVGAVGTRQVATAVADALMKSPVVMVKGHGSFAAGKTLEEALCYTSALEDSCKIILALGRGGKS
ncbi:MAG: class II aldolase/adducin family protein [Candidatus Brocadiales bacterium]